MKNNICENVRRFWPILLVWTLFNLIAGPIPMILMNSAEIVRINMFGLYAQANGGFGLIFINTVFAVVIGVAVFRYAHRPGTISVMHSLPIRRRTLFLSNWLSGLIFIAIPQVITTITLLPFVKLSFAHLFVSRSAIAEISPSYDEVGYISNPAYHADAGDLIHFLLITMLTIFFIYSLTVLAGVITGSSPLHLLVACLLNAVVPAIYYIAESLFGMFLYGFDGGFNGMRESIGQNLLHPLITFNDMPAAFTRLEELLYALFFLVVAAVVSLVSLILYTKLKSEKVGNSFTFALAERVVVIVFSIMGMVLVGQIFASSGYRGLLAQDEPFGLFYLGAFLGLAITFMLAMMIARKTSRIFDIQTLKSFGICLLCGIIVTVCTTTDISGFEKRLPDIKTVKSVTVNITNFNILPYRWSFDIGAPKITGEDGIAKVIALHDLITNSEKKFAPWFYGEDDVPEDEVTSAYPSTIAISGPGIGERFSSNGELSIRYLRNNGYSMSRGYILSASILDTEQFRSLIESKSYKEATTIDKRFGYKKLTGVYLAYMDYRNDSISEKTAFEKDMTKAELQELAALLDKDYKDLSAKDLAGNDAPELFTFGFEYKGKDINEFVYSVTEKYTKTIAWLKAKGYYDDMVAATARLKSEYEEMNKTYD